jgi:hypothetical protein
MPTKRDSRAPKQQKELTRHELAIRMLINSDPHIHRNGFLAAMRELVAAEDCEDDCIPERMLPDAYRIDRAGGWIDIFEVDDTHPIPAHKLQAYANLWEAWDGEGRSDFMPRLFNVDRYGKVQGEIDLRAIAYAL